MRVFALPVEAQKRANPMSTLSLGQAAKAVGKSKPTLLKAIKTGRLKAVKGNREWQIDTDDLFKVWPRLTEATGSPTGSDTGSDGAKVAALETEVRLLREMLDQERNTVGDLRQRLDRAERELADRRRGPRWWPFQ